MPEQMIECSGRKSLCETPDELARHKLPRLHGCESSLTHRSSGKALLSSGNRRLECCHLSPVTGSSGDVADQMPCLGRGAAHARSSRRHQRTAGCLTHLEAGLQQLLHGSTLPGRSAPRRRVLCAQRRSLRLGHSSHASSRAGCPLPPATGISPGLPAAGTPPRFCDTSAAQPQCGVPLPAV